METCLYLTRRDADRNMARFYRMEVAPDLFGGAVLIRQWGRIGGKGRELREWWPDAAGAGEALALWARRKTRKGYAPG